MADSADDFGRIRRPRKVLRQRQVDTSFVNPYPQMSGVEARVHLELERRFVPFSWRYFDGDSPSLKFLMPDYQPEFTLREYRVVIIVLGNFVTHVPGLLDRNALAATLLEQDGWKVALWWEGDIRQDVISLMDRDLPMLRAPVVTGPPRNNPFGTPDMMARRREALARSAARRRRTFFERKARPLSERDPEHRRTGGRPRNSPSAPQGPESNRFQRPRWRQRGGWSM